MNAKKRKNPVISFVFTQVAFSTGELLKQLC